MIDKIHIEDVMSHYGQLTRASVSGKTLKCHCPFHYDEFKSMKISTRQNTYECELCGEKGDLVDFIENIEGCSRKSAIRILADFDKTQIFYRDNQFHVDDKVKVDIQFLLEKMPEHALYRMLVDSLEPYIPKDEIAERTYVDFGVGVTPEIFPSQFANLKGELIFPIYNLKKDVLGFVATSRSVKKKYKCWPEDLLANSFYGLSQAIRSIENAGFIYLVKDCEDVVIMHAAGFTNTISYMDNSLSFVRVQTLVQLTRQVVLFNSEDIPTQVQCTKNTARLSFERISSIHIYLPENIGLKDIYNKLGAKDFVYFIRQSNRLSRLDNLRLKVASRLDELAFDMERADTITRRVELRSNAIPLQNKLNKLLSILGNYSVDYMLEK